MSSATYVYNLITSLFPLENSRCWGYPLSGLTAHVLLPSQICSSADNIRKGKERALPAACPGDAASGFRRACRTKSACNTVSTQTLGVVSSCWAPLDFTPPFSRDTGRLLSPSSCLQELGLIHNKNKPYWQNSHLGLDKGCLKIRKLVLRLCVLVCLLTEQKPNLRV